MSFTQTERSLAQITDEGLFEKLATAVLRAAEPRYKGLAHPGVNTDGKTIKSPFDGISFCTNTVPPHLFVAHHTTTACGGLAKKWLHDPAAVQHRKENRATAPEGDVVKTARIIAEERLKTPGLKATLVLTTNQEPDSQTILDVGAAGAAADIEIDVWSRARFAQFLDTKPDGQFLRRHYLKIETTLLSRDLLLELSAKSLDVHPVRDLPAAYVPRGLDAVIVATRRPITFLVASSGFGKTVACRKLLAAQIAAHRVGLILTQENISAALTLPDAIEHALCQLHPDLAPGAGSAALEISSPNEPLLLIVDDINHSGQSALLAERIEGWSRIPDSNSSAQRPYRLLCPLWPEVLVSLEERARKSIEAIATFGSAYKPLEGRAAVQRLAELRGRPISEMTADAISAALGHDPLLIGLHDPTKAVSPSGVIADFVEQAIGRTVRSHPDYAAWDYRNALRTYAGAALERRALNPSWSEVATWESVSASDRICLNHLMHDRELLYLTGPSDRQRVDYRHDRVRDWLLADAAESLAESGALGAEVLSDPFYAEILGAVLVRKGADTTLVARVCAQNPLALFYALQALPQSAPDRRAVIIGAIETWLSEPATRQSSHRYLRMEALSALALTDGPEIGRLVDRLGIQGHTAWQARLRNGDLSGGIALCASLEPGSSAPWRDLQIDHAKLKFGNNLIVKLNELLRRESLTAAARLGTVRLAGHIAAPELADSLAVCWASDAGRVDHLGDYLWACAECCGAAPERYLAPICGAWAALPASRDATNESPRDRLAAYHVNWAFKKWVPHSAIPYFVQRAREEDLHWPILILLSGVDDPVAIDFVVHEIAAMERRLEGTQSIHPFAVTSPDHWRRQQEQHGFGMSSTSRALLQALWIDPCSDKHLRRAAFRLWAATDAEGDMDLLRQPSVVGDLASNILQERLRRGDRSAVPMLINKLNSAEQRMGWWYQVKYVWSDELLSVLDVELARRSQTVSSESAHECDTDYAVSDLLMRLSPEVGETLLLKHWAPLKDRSHFVQAALYLATPALQEKVREAIASSTDPKKLLQYLGQHLGIKVQGHPGITREAQIEALVPYLSHLERHEITRLCDVCNQNGWFTLRRAKLDPILRKTREILYVDEAPTFLSLDEMMDKKRVYWLDHWLDEYAKTGATPDMIVALVAAWVALRKTLGALNVALDVLVHIGRRKDLEILAVELDPSEAGAADTIRADAAFAVKRRSLN